MEAVTEASQPPMSIERVDNHIYFYADIDPASALTLIKLLKEADLDNRRAQWAGSGNEDRPIYLHINSLGGDAYSSFAIVDTIEPLSSEVYSVVEGMAGSGASMVAMACDRAYITPNSFMLIHQLSGVIVGTHHQMNDGKKLNDLIMERLVEFYFQHSALNRKRIKELLEHDTAVNAETAIEYGFVDEIYEG